MILVITISIVVGKTPRSAVLVRVSVARAGDGKRVIDLEAADVSVRGFLELEAERPLAVRFPIANTTQRGRR